MKESKKDGLLHLGHPLHYFFNLLKTKTSLPKASLPSAHTHFLFTPCRHSLPETLLPSLLVVKVLAVAVAASNFCAVDASRLLKLGVSCLWIYSICLFIDLVCFIHRQRFDFWIWFWFNLVDIKKWCGFDMNMVLIYCNLVDFLIWFDLTWFLNIVLIWGCSHSWWVWEIEVLLLLFEWKR